MTIEKASSYVILLILSGSLIMEIAIHFQNDFDFLHEGMVAYTANKIINGADPISVFSQYGPLYNFLSAIILFLGENQFIYLRIFTGIVYVAVLFPIWSLSYRTSRWFAVMLWTFFSVYFYPSSYGYLLVWPPVLSLLTSMLILLFIYHWIVKSNNWAGILVGVFAALTIWIKINVGIYLTLALIGSIAAHRIFNPRDNLILMPLIGILGVLVIMIFLIALSEQGIDYFSYQLGLAKALAPQIPEVWFNRPNSLSFVFETLFPLNNGIPTFWIFPPVIAVLIYLLISLKIVFGNIDRPLLLIWLWMAIGIASWGQYYPVSEHLHFYWASMPIIAGLSLSLGVIIQRYNVLALRIQNQWVELGGIVVAIMIFATTLTNYVNESIDIGLTTSASKNVQIFNGIKFSPDKAKLINSYIAALNDVDHKDQGLRLLNFTPDPWVSEVRSKDINLLDVPSYISFYIDAEPDVSKDAASLLNIAPNFTTSSDLDAIFTMGYQFKVPSWELVKNFDDGRSLIEPTVGLSSAESAFSGVDCGSTLFETHLVNKNYLKDTKRFWGINQPLIPLGDNNRIEMLFSLRNVEGEQATILSNVGRGADHNWRGFEIRKFTDDLEPYLALVEYQVDGAMIVLLRFELKPEELNHLSLNFDDGVWSGSLNGNSIGTAKSRFNSLEHHIPIKFNSARSFASYYVGEIFAFRVDDTSECGLSQQSVYPNYPVAEKLFSIADR